MANRYRPENVPGSAGSVYSSVASLMSSPLRHRMAISARWHDASGAPAVARRDVHHHVRPEFTHRVGLQARVREGRARFLGLVGYR